MLGMKLAIDFGSAELTILAENKATVLREPSVMIYDSFTDTPIAMGEEALAMRGRLPPTMKEVIPIKDGSVYDFDAALRMLQNHISRICQGKLLKPGVLMAVPDSVNEIERKTLIDVVTRAGAGRACFIPESLAAAAGAGVRKSEAEGILVCDAGGGITECAVISMWHVAASHSVKVGGNDLSNAIRDYILHEYNLVIGEDAAEEIKLNVGSAIYRTEEIAVIVCGKNPETGLPQFFEITSTEVYWILKSYMEEILGCVRSVLETIPVELLSDVMQRGILLCGGTANLFGIDRYIEWNTGIPTHRAASPEECAVQGLGIFMNEERFLKKNGYQFISSEEEETA